MTDRLAREIEFHDQRFADGVGARQQDRFYAAVQDAADLVDAKVAECAHRGGAGLEIGCAAGHTIDHLLARGPFEAFGIDISSAAITAAQRNFEGRTSAANFSVMDANNLTFPDARFDFVFGKAVLHHLELPRCLHEGRRVLRPGGRFVFMEPLGTNPFIEWYRRATPADRSPDETPLTAAHVAQLRSVFGSDVALDFFGFLTLAAIPFGRWPSMQKAVLALTRRLDRVFFALPGAWRLAWMVVIDATVQPDQRRGGA